MINIKNQLLNFKYSARKVEDFLRHLKRSTLFNFKKNTENTLIALVDGHNYHGGFTDRIKGIVSLYHFCLIKKINFRLKYSFPFDLSNYLLPNTYNWIILNKDISNNFFWTKFINLVGDSSIKRLKNIKTKNPIIAYANRDIVEELNRFYGTAYSWGELYNQLFKPTTPLQTLIDEHKKALDDSYIAAHFRFVGMFGDFNEQPYQHIEDEKKREIFELTTNFLKNLSREFKNKKIFVASDSKIFIDKIKNIDGIYTLSGDIVHIDNPIKDKDDTAFMRLLLDFYLIANSEKVFSIGTDEMYKSELPLYASKIYNIDFQRVIIK